MLRHENTFHFSGNPAYLTVALDSDLGIIDPYRASDNFVKKFKLSNTGNKIESYDILWSSNESLVFWANKQDNNIFLTTLPINAMNSEVYYKKLLNDSGSPLVNEIVLIFHAVKIKELGDLRSVRMFCRYVSTGRYRVWR